MQMKSRKALGETAKIAKTTKIAKISKFCKAIDEKWRGNPIDISKKSSKIGYPGLCAPRIL